MAPTITAFELKERGNKYATKSLTRDAFHKADKLYRAFKAGDYEMAESLYTQASVRALALSAFHIH